MVLEILKFKDFNNYFAHTSKNKDRYETLYEHTALVCKYFNTLIEVHGLKKIIEKLIENLAGNCIEKEQCKRIIKSIFFTVPEFHDIGKINPNFQNKKMNNSLFNEIRGLSSGSDHSKIGAFLFIQSFLEKINNIANCNDKRYLFFILYVFSFVISKHHAPNIEFIRNFDFGDNFIEDFIKVINSLEIDLKFVIQDKNLLQNIRLVFENRILNFNSEIRKKYEYIPFSLFSIIKLSYSLLTAADYYATTHFMNSWQNMEKDFGILNKELKNKIIESIKFTKDYNKKIFKDVDNYKLKFPEEANNENLNILRKNLAIEVIRNIRENYDKNLFYIEAPTGSGKTNLSMIAIAELLKKDIEFKQNNITKIFYVFPFTTLITQTYNIVKETFNLNTNDIVQIHSKTGFVSKNDDMYGCDNLNIIDYQFINYPVALISHIKFFDILKSNSKYSNYLLHRIANSIIIIDELQAYNPKQWDKIIYFINNYAYFFNIKFILMSATLPKIDKLLLNNANNVIKNKFVYLIENKDKYFQNPNFKNRVEFDFSMMNFDEFNKGNIKNYKNNQEKYKDNKKESKDSQEKCKNDKKEYKDNQEKCKNNRGKYENNKKEYENKIEKNNKEQYFKILWEKILTESYNYSKIYGKVHTIIEFIFKSSANLFMNFVEDKNNFFDKIFLLSGTILEPRRKEIIDSLKSNVFKNKNILLITTQVVEAGVDIDMDIGFKDVSLIDSDEQLAGRINRNVRKKDSKLFLFNLDNEKIIYGEDYRLKNLQNNERQEILNSKNFDKIYNMVIEYRNNFNNQGLFDDNLSSYIDDYIKNLNFSEIDRNFKLIKNDNRIVTFFVPVKISKKHFDKKELNFLKKRNYYNDEDQLDGEKVWELYCDLVENRSDDFIKDKIDRIIMLGILSKFIISLYADSNEFNQLINSGNCEEKYGFYKLHNLEEVYDYEKGIKYLNFENTNIW